MAGDPVTGASTFLIERGLDTGPVLGVMTETIRPADTAGTRLERLAVAGAGLLVATLDARFASLEQDLAAYGSLEQGFTTYDQLTTEQVKGLADGVNALSEPLSKLTGALVG